MDDKPTVAENGLEPPCEGLAGADPRTIGPAKTSQEVRCELGSGHELLEFEDRGIDLLIQCHARHWLLTGAGWVASRHAMMGEIRVKDPATLHFVPVVVLGIDP